MPNEFLGEKTIITIEEIIDKGSQLKIKGTGHDGSHIYTCWKNKQDGSPTQAYSFVRNKTIGDQIEVGWETYNGEYQGKPYTSRTVKFINEPSKSSTIDQRARKVENTTGYANAFTKLNSSPTQGEKTDWDKISWGKCKYGFLIELLKKEIPLEEAEPKAEAWADASMRKGNFGEVNLDIPPF